MKRDAPHSNKPPSHSPRPASHRRRLERLLKKVLAGEVSIHTVAQMAEEFTALPHRHIVE